MLEAVQIRDAERVMSLYPHEVSGGMGQRVMIAMMLVAEPEMLIADEPTSALDVTVQLEVLSILDQLVAERGMGLIFISHDRSEERRVGKEWRPQWVGVDQAKGRVTAGAH